MSVPLETYVRLWSSTTPELASYDEELEVASVIDWRDAIEDAIEGGSTEGLNASMLAEGDQALRAAAPTLALKWPRLWSELRRNDRWWWRLDRIAEPGVRRAS